MAPQPQEPPNPSRLRAAEQRDQAVAELATSQHGVVSRQDLIELGFKPGAIRRRLEAGRLHPVHRGVYAVGHMRLTQRGRWRAAVLACGEGAVLSHASAAALWGLVRARNPVDVTSARGRGGRSGICLHQAKTHPQDLTVREGIPVTSVARTLLDLAEVENPKRLEKTFEEADRLGLLKLRELEALCERSKGRKGLRTIRALIATAHDPTMSRSQLEQQFAALCHRRGLPRPVRNVLVEGREVDVVWPRQKLIVELDGFAFHRHRAAFERDRTRDAALQAAGYRVIRLTHRRLKDTPAAVASELRRLLAA